MKAQLTLFFGLLFLSSSFSFTIQNSVSQKFILDYNGEEQITFSPSAVRVSKSKQDTYSIKAQNGYSQTIGYIHIELLLPQLHKGKYSFTKSAEYPILTCNYGINFNTSIERSFFVKGSISITSIATNSSISGTFEGITAEGKQIKGSFENISIN